MNVQRLRFLVKHTRMASSLAGKPEDLLIQAINGKGVITWNRPKVLNAFNLFMIRGSYQQIQVCVKLYSISKWSNCICCKFHKGIMRRTKRLYFYSKIVDHIHKGLVTGTKQIDPRFLQKFWMKSPTERSDRNSSIFYPSQKYCSSSRKLTGNAYTRVRNVAQC